MKNIFMIIVFSFFLFNTSYANEQKIIKYGFIYQYNILTDFKDARESLKKWIELIAKKRDIDLEVIFFDSDDEIFNALLNDKLDLASINNEFFFKNKEIIKEKTNSYWTISLTEDRSLKYCLVNRSDVKFNSYKDLKGKSISLGKRANELSSKWLEKKSLEHNKTSFRNLVKNTTLETKESTLLLNTFFKKTDLAVIRKDTWETMLELNPSIKKQVNLFECGNTDFVPFIGVFSNKTDKKRIDSFFDFSSEISKGKEYSQILTLLNFKFMYKIEKNELDNLEKFYDDYEQLKEKYLK